MLPIVFFPYPCATGTYEGKIGLVGAGGIANSLVLTADGRFSYSTRGCFGNETYVGRYRQRGETIDLVEEGAQKMPWRRYRLRLVDGMLYLLNPEEAKHLGRGVPGELTLRKQAQPPAPMSLRKNAPLKRTASAAA